MDFGKLPSVDHIDFTLPHDPPGNAALLAELATESHHSLPQTLYIGATGWGMKEWVGSIYPKGAKPAEFLHHYTRQFNTIELNTTHYRIPDLLTVQHWYEESAADFRFCPKVLQAISHSADLGAKSNLTELFCESMKGLREKLGCCFIQLPPYFGHDRLPVLESFLARFTLPLAVEVRQEDWFNNPLHFNHLTELLRKYEASTVITDVAGRRDVCHMGLTSGNVLVRFVGNNLHPSDYTRISGWAERLSDWFSKGLQAAYVFTHEPDNLLAPELAMYLKGEFGERSPVSTRGPQPVAAVMKGEQLSLF
jgi:uncharacterized protein YecE (DUF72 family)